MVVSEVSDAEVVCVYSWCRYWSKWPTYQTRCGRWVSLHRGSTVCWPSSSTRSHQSPPTSPKLGGGRTLNVARRPPSWPRVCWRWACWLCLLTCYTSFPLRHTRLYRLTGCHRNMSHWSGWVKTGHFTLAHNFTKCWQIFRILPLETW